MGSQWLKRADAREGQTHSPSAEGLQVRPLLMRAGLGQHGNRVFDQPTESR